MNPLIWKLISDYIHDRYWRKIDKMSDAELAEHLAKKEEKPSWTKILRKEEAEGSPFSGIDMETGRSVELDDVGIDWQPAPTGPYDNVMVETAMRHEAEAERYDNWLRSGGEPEYSESWRVFQRAIEEKKDEKRRKSKKLKKASKGHSRRGGGGGYLPADISGSLKDDSIKSRILGHRRKPWS